MSDANRRSGRNRKSIDYTRLDSLGDMDDDDFTNSSPPHKRQKQKSEKKMAKSDSKKPKLDSLKVEKMILPIQRKERVSVSEKVFERHVKETLLLSTTTTTCAGKENTSLEANKKDRAIESFDLVSDSPLPDKHDKALHLVPVVQNVGAVLLEAKVGMEQVEEVEANVESNLDSDFSNKKTRTKQQEESVERLKVTRTSNVGNQTKTSVMKSSPLVRPLSTAGCINMPSRKLRIPNTGLRLGLSRKVPAKPLHSFVEAQH